MAGLPDLLAPGLRAVIVGTAVADASAARGHYYAGPGNEFWQLLHDSGLTAERLTPDRDLDILGFSLGLTDLVKRRSASSDAVLTRLDFDVRSFRARSVGTDRAGSRSTARARRRKSRTLSDTVATSASGARVGRSKAPRSSSCQRIGREPSRLSRLEGKASRLAWFPAFSHELDRAAAKQPSRHIRRKTGYRAAERSSIPFQAAGGS
jgi:hypothetical protein